jgi:hypothetical protein
MCRGLTVREVFRAKPSYLVWTMVYTNHRFSHEVVQALHEEVAKGPNRNMTVSLVEKFREIYQPGPW